MLRRALMERNAGIDVEKNEGLLLEERRAPGKMPEMRRRDEDEKVVDNGMLSPEDALRQGELAEGVRKIKVRNHALHLVPVLIE